MTASGGRGARPLEDSSAGLGGRRGEARAGAGPEHPRAAPLALALALAAGGAALLVATGTHPGLAGALALPAILLGPGLALVSRGSPSSSSLLEQGAIAWLLSPPLFAGLLGALSLILAPPQALAAALALVALAQGLALRTRLGAPPEGRAAWAAIAAGPLLAAAVLALHASAPVLALWGDGMWWSGAAAEATGPRPHEDPWLAGTPLVQGLGPALLLGAFGRALGLEPSAALATLVAWPLVALPPVLYCIAASLWLEPRRALAAVLLGLAGGAAGVGLASLADGGAAAAVEGFEPFLRAMVAARHGGPHGLPLAPLAAALVPGAAMAAWALAALTMLAAVHALRSARRPWVGLLGLCAALTLLLDPALGLAAAGAIALAALLAPGGPGVAPRVLAVLGVWLLVAVVAQPGAVLRGPELGALAGPDRGLLAAGLGLLAVAALPLLARRVRPALGGPGWGAGPDRSGRRAIAVLLLAAAGSGLAVGCLDRPAGLFPGSAALLAQISLGALAAGGLVGALSAPGRPRAWAALTSAALLAGLAVSGWRSLAALAQARALDPRLTLEEALREAPYPGGPLGPAWPPEAGDPDPVGLAADRALAWKRLAERAGSIEPPPVLVLGEAQEVQRRRYAPVPHPAPLLARIPLWTDRSVPHTRAHPRHEPRTRAVRELYEERTALGRELLAELVELDRSAILWVDSDDRARSTDLDRRLRRLGFHPLLEVGQVTLFRWTPPQAVATGRAR